MDNTHYLERQMDRKDFGNPLKIPNCLLFLMFCDQETDFTFSDKGLQTLLLKLKYICGSGWRSYIKSVHFSGSTPEPSLHISSYIFKHNAEHQKKFHGILQHTRK